MTDLLWARSQMAMSLAFHIVFAVVGVAMPLLMVIAEGLYLRRREEVYLVLAKRWAKGTAILFAVGAVSGTVLSFELGLLWPRFMEKAGAIIGMPFSLEGFAFFLEAIFIGIYLYGWDRVRPVAHWVSGVAVLISGSASAVFVVTANAFMNAPAGFDLVDGELTNLRPFEAMFNPAAATQVTHMLIASFQTVAVAVAAIHAAMLLRDRTNLFHRKALGIALVVATLSSVLQPLSGDFLAKQVARNQPVKLAAMEGQWDTERGAPLRIGGWPDEQAEETRYSIEIPYGLSVLAYGNTEAEVLGLRSFPRDERPPVAVVHLSFQLMVACGTALLGAYLLLSFLAWRRRRLPDERRWLRLVVLCGPLGVIALEAGWTVTEVGRQPWVIQGVMRTADSVTPMPGLVVPFLTFTVLYFVLAVVVIVLLRRHVFASPRIPEVAADPAEANDAVA